MALWAACLGATYAIPACGELQAAPPKGVRSSTVAVVDASAADEVPGGEATLAVGTEAGGAHALQLTSVEVVIKGVIRGCDSGRSVPFDTDAGVVKLAIGDKRCVAVPETVEADGIGFELASVSPAPTYAVGAPVRFVTPDGKRDLFVIPREQVPTPVDAIGRIRFEVDVTRELPTLKVSLSSPACTIHPLVQGRRVTFTVTLAEELVVPRRKVQRIRLLPCDGTVGALLCGIKRKRTEVGRVEYEIEYTYPRAGHFEATAYLIGSGGLMSCSERVKID